MMHDIRYGVRVLLRNPASTAVALITLALGIGANTAIFSILDATMLKPLPFREAERLVDIIAIERAGTAEQSFVGGMTRERLADWRSQSQVFESIEAHKNPRPFKLGDSDTTVRVAQVSPGLFPLLGVSPALGRGLADDEPGSAVLVSTGLWTRLFGADPNVLGRQIVLNNKSMTVVGVMPPAARYPLGSTVDAWMPLSHVRDPADPAGAYVDVVARLRRGLTIDSAQSEIARAAERIQQARPDRERWGAKVESIDLRERRTGSQPVVNIIFAAVAFVLLAACANIANLLLARASGRRREMAIRAALGASRTRVARQFLVESVLLAAAGGGAAILLALWIVRSLPTWLPPRLIVFYVHDVELDWRVLAFALAVSLAAGVLSGVLPAWRGSETTGTQALAASAGPSGPTRSHRRTRNALITIQVALALVLLMGAGLMTASFVRLVSADPGFDVEGLVATSVTLPAGGYKPGLPQHAFFATLLDAVRATPGVESVTLGTPPPQDGAGRLVAEGSARTGSAALLTAGPDYFKVLGITIVSGRDFSPDDRLGATPVAVVDEDAARILWPGENPLGKRVRYSPYVPWMTVVGVARNIKTGDLGRSATKCELYIPMTQQERLPYATVLTRTSGRPGAVLDAVRAHALGIDRKVGIPSAGTVESLYDPALANPRFFALMMSLFAGLALLTAAVGLYGTLSYTVAQRTQEIGVRMALGANRADLRRLIVLDGLWPVVAGIVLGSVAAQWLTRYIASQLFHVGPRDPLTMGLVLFIFVAVALVASYIPARRATRVDPLVALRAE